MIPPKAIRKRKAPPSPSTRVRSALRKMWLISPERKAAIKRSGMRCEGCGKALARRRVDGDVPEVHHIDGATWTEIIELVIRQLLVSADRLLVLCKACHHEADRKVRDNRKGQGALKL